MKFYTKLAIISIVLLIELFAAAKVPVYEVPSIAKNNSPLGVNFNHRNDLLNTPSTFKRAYGSWKGKKEDLRSELARGFSLVNCNYFNIKNTYLQFFFYLLIYNF